MSDDENSEKNFRDEFSDRIQTVDLDELPSLINQMMDRKHDYGTICVALGMAAAATAWAMNKHHQGGVTGFQSGAIAWEFLRHWGALYPRGECGGRFVDFDDLLYPQYASKFTSISESTWEALQKEAAKKLSGKDGSVDNAHSAVVDHWRSITNGVVPFGLSLTRG